MDKNPAKIFNQLLKAKYDLAQEYRLLGVTETREIGTYSLIPPLGLPQCSCERAEAGQKAGGNLRGVQAWRRGVATAMGNA